MLSNCSASISLSRYSKRHNTILEIIANYLTTALRYPHSLHVDLPNYPPISNLFSDLIPDIAIVHEKNITVVELTVCHESNFTAAKDRKMSKYQSLKSHLTTPYLNHTLSLSTVEVSVLGFIQTLSPLAKLLKIDPLPDKFLNNLSTAAIVHSKEIYYNRNDPDNM